MHNCKDAGLSRSESGTFYLYTVIILLSSCFFIPTAVLFYKPAVRSSLPCAHNSSGSVGDRIQIIPPSIDELPSSADLLPVIPACAAFPHYLLSVIYSFTRRFSVHFICTTHIQIQVERRTQTKRVDQTDTGIEVTCTRTFPCEYPA